MSKSNGSRQRSMAGRLRTVAILCVLVMVGGWAGRQSGINPLAWWRGVWPNGATNQPASQTPSGSQDEVDELPTELLAAQFEPDSDDPADDTPVAVAPDMNLLFDEDAFGTGGVFRANFEEPAENASEPTRTAARDADRPPPRLMEMRDIEALEAAGNLIAAQRELSQWYWQSPERRADLLPRLNDHAKALYFSPRPHYYEPYVVQQGDQLRLIGKRYKLSWEYLSQLNQVEATRIRMGQKLKVVPGPFSAHVSLKQYELVVHLQGSFVRRFSVGLGKPGLTPVGTFKVINKLVDPTYYGEEGVISGKDARNPLGVRWIDIGDSFGIHGTNEPDTIGKNESRGCVRMLNDDVKQVYDLLTLDSEATIER
ncbi:MAG: L,D-transpeptidase family protein [Planctomycetales bacterium]